MSELEIGLVGVGPWGKHVLRDLRSLEAHVHAVARSEASIARARDGGAKSIVDDPSKLPVSCAGYVVANRTISHLDAVESLLPRGAPIFVEKPLGVDLERIKRLPEAAQRLVFIMHKWRYHPGIRELAAIVATKRYGAVKGLRTFRLGWGNPHPDVSSLWILAPHDLSIALHILGETPQLHAASADPLSGADSVNAQLSTSSGIPVSFEVSSAHPIPLRRIVLACERAVCVLDGRDYAALTIQRFDATESETLKVGDEMPLLTELRYFIGHLKGGPPPLTALKDEIAIVTVLREIENAVSA